MFSTSNILDTLRLDKTGFFLKEIHAERTFETYQALNVQTELPFILKRYDRIEAELLKSFSTSQRVRIIFDRKDFTYQIQSENLGLALRTPIQLQVVKNAKQEPGLGLMNYKWADRRYWDQLLARKLPNADDIIAVNKNNYVTETSRFNIFTYSEVDDVVYTPSLDSGCINGVYRRHILKKGNIDLPTLGPKQVFEKDITAENILNANIFVGNSVRGLLTAELFF